MKKYALFRKNYYFALLSEQAIAIFVIAEPLFQSSESTLFHIERRARLILLSKLHIQKLK